MFSRVTWVARREEKLFDPLFTLMWVGDQKPEFAVGKALSKAVARDYSSRCAAPRILKHPEGARNSHFAKASRPGARFPSRTSRVGFWEIICRLSIDRDFTLVE